jgi:hypothetical protein
MVSGFLLDRQRVMIGGRGRCLRKGKEGGNDENAANDSQQSFFEHRLLRIFSG